MVREKSNPNKLHFNAIDMTGKRYGRLTVLRLSDKRSWDGRLYWVCQCDCGNVVERLGEALRYGLTKSCGCYNREVASKRSYKHGGCPRGGHERLFDVWNMMKQRCTNPNNKSYMNYGGRGITVCAEWLSDYGSFRKWAVESGYDELAKNHECTLDRIDNNKGYSPENCRWVPMSVQANNCRTNHLITYKGETLSVSQMSKKYGMNYHTLLRRINHGWTTEEAIETKIGEKRNGK